jgi:HPt (histidine-containing phosphotransfer) domain-containing protein
VGATALEQLAAALESAIVAELPASGLVARWVALQRELAGLVVTIRSHLPVADEPPPAPADPQRAEALLDRLEEQLARGDFAARAAWGDVASLMHAAEAGAACQFETLLRDYDFPRALGVLREMREQWRGPLDVSDH